MEVRSFIADAVSSHRPAISLASVAGQPLAAWLEQLPGPWRVAAEKLLAPRWPTAVSWLCQAGQLRAWALAESPGASPAVFPHSPYLDACDVLHLAADGQSRFADMADIAQLSASLADWSQRRCAHWHRLLDAAPLPVGLRQAFSQFVVPLEWRLRDQLITHIWRHSLQGEILPSPAFAIGHPLTLPLLRWITAPSSSAGMLSRRDLVRRARSAVVLAMAAGLSSAASRRDVFRVMASLCKPQQPRPTIRRIASALAPLLDLPAWALRRLMALDWHFEVGPVDSTLDQLRRLSRQLPAAVWPRDRIALADALRCLRAIEGMTCFGLYDERWPAVIPRLPARVRSWLLRELRCRFGGNWALLASALDEAEPRYQLLARMLPQLELQWQHVYEEEPDRMEQLSASWRAASPDWWMERLPQWWARVGPRPAVQASRRGLAWKPLFEGRSCFGSRSVRCLSTVQELRSLLQAFNLEHLIPWLGPSLIGRVQWLLFETLEGRRPCSLVVLHARLQRAELVVELIQHASLQAGPELSRDCGEAFLLLWADWQERQWGELSRVEAEQILTEDEALWLAVDRSRVRAWQRVANMGSLGRPDNASAH